MIKKIELLGIQLDNYTVREAMLQVESYLNNTVMSTIEAVSMKTLVLAGEDETLKESLESLDLAIVDEKEILKAAGVNSPQRIKETVDGQFFTEFMKRILRNGKTIYLFGSTKEQVEELRTFLEENYNRLHILGGFSIEDCAGDYDGAVNEINVISPDVIFSILPTPEQEYFLMENKGKMNVKIWYGLGEDYRKHQGVPQIKSLIKKMIHKGKLHSMLSRYDRTNGDD